MECSELISPNAVTLADVPEDGWYLISPLGEFEEPGSTYVQIFGAEQAREVVATFNSISGKAGRFLKNMWHGIGAKLSVPIFEGHSDRDSKRWPTMNQLGEITDLRADQDGLWGNVTWNAANLAKREHELGPLKPSPIFWHDPKDAANRVFPALLESVGLVRFPNIKTAPTWTQNANPLASEVEAQSTANEKPMNEEQLKALRIALNLPADTDPQKVIDTARSAYQLSTSNATALQTANSAKAELETKLNTANGKVTSLTSEVETLRTTNGILVDGALDLFEAAGKFTPAQRPDIKAKFTSNVADTVKSTITELKEKKPEMNTKTMELNGNRVDLSTANARRSAMDAAISTKMKELNTEDRGVAYDAVMEDPKYKGLVDAMKPKAQAA